MVVHDNPYSKASYLEKLRETGTIFLTDLDGTHATRGGDIKEINDRAAIRKLLDERRWVSGAVTARTPALVMSSDVYEASVANGYKEPPPLCGLDVNRKRVYVKPEEIPFFAHSQNWDMIGSVGWGVFPRNGLGYLVDEEFDNLLNYDYAGYRPIAYSPRQFPPLEEYVPWRQAALAFLSDVFPQANEHMSELESTVNYWEGRVDVAPLPYRIQLEFKGAHGRARLRELRAAIVQRVSQDIPDPVALRLAFIDESKPNADLAQAKYTVYLVPWNGRKESIINRFVQKSQAAVRRLDPAFKLRDLLYAGDTPTDFRAGLYARGDGPMKFLLATGSLLAPYLMERRRTYGEEALDFLWESSTRSNPRLSKTHKQGVYTFKVGSRPWTNLVVIGDERYPKMTPPGSVLAFLEEFGKPNADP